ncbi:hypothetical protein LOZ80_14020 [Paenibacillus sp. HWE-109]|uniref:hypothetical protein n=1 Tax=Paenibacillus sp. HWE-109 TaxID=1306526 RepID=UPI001EDE1271|nr:hypothetical protein [Paenibacillus sp. HWE-109]UKS29984.1 hypothetical protein LOZ80_14020 [Paenibacillus sp. HWE-109]
MPAKPVTIKQDAAWYLFICNLLCAKEVFIPLDVANRKKLLVARENRLHINGVVWKAARVANKRNSTKQEDDLVARMRTVSDPNTLKANHW